MKYVVIDLEMNPIASVYKEERTTCKLEVIEIGAILLDDCLLYTSDAADE